MTIFAQTRRLSLGFRYRCLLACAVLLPTLLSGVAAAQNQAPIFDWEGTVEVEVIGSSSLSVALKAGETKRYRLRLTKPLPTKVVIEDNEEKKVQEKGWWVRIHVDGGVRIDGYYDPNNPDADRDNSAISWVPSVGWQFDPDDWERDEDMVPLQDESKWRGVTIKAHKDVETPIRFMHDVLDAQSECPENLKGLGKLFVSTIGTDPPPPPPPLLPSAVAPTVTIGTVASVADDATLELTAGVAGGTYDTVTYGWAVVAGGGSITGATATATYRPPDVATDTAVEVRVTVTARGTGTTAREGTAATATDTEPFTVTDSETMLLPSAVAPTVTIGTVASVADDATLELTAGVAGGTYDTVTYGWAVVAGGGSITGADATATYRPPDVATDTAVEVRVTVTARGTGITAREGTAATATDTEPFTVTDSETMLLPSAVAPTVTIGTVASVADDATLELTAGVAGGTYDTVTYGWAVVAGGGSITGADATATYRPPDVATDTAVEVRVTVTARGTGITAREGTAATATDTEPFTVTDSGNTPSDGDGGNNGENNLIDGNNGGGGGTTQPRAPSSDARLRNLVLHHGTTRVPLMPTFMPETTKYTATVDSDVTQVTVMGNACPSPGAADLPKCGRRDADGCERPSAWVPGRVARGGR